MGSSDNLLGIDNYTTLKQNKDSSWNPFVYFGHTKEILGHRTGQEQTAISRGECDSLCTNDAAHSKGFSPSVLYRSRTHERTISLRFLGTILRIVHFLSCTLNHKFSTGRNKEALITRSGGPIVTFTIQYPITG